MASAEFGALLLSRASTDEECPRGELPSGTQSSVRDDRDGSRMSERHSQAFGDVARFAARVRRALRVRALLTFLSVSAIAVTGLLALGVFLVLVVGAVPGLRAGLLAALALALAATTYLTLLRPVRRARRLVDVARFIETRVPGLRDGVLSCLELDPDGPGAESARRVSLDLMVAHAAATAARLGGVEPRSLVSKRRVRVLGAIVGVLAAGIALGVGLYGDVLLQGARALVSPPRSADAGGPPGPIHMSVLVGDLALAYTFPDYAGVPPRHERNVAGDIRGLPGTEVEIATRALHQARSAELVLESRPDEPVQLELDAERRITGRITVSGDDRYHFRLRRPDGVLLVESVARTIEAVPDMAPEVRLLSPEDDLEVNGDDAILLRYEASDDYGLDSAALVYEREGLGPEPVHRRLDETFRPGTNRAQATFDLKALAPRPGERITVWIEVTDNDAISGGKTSSSARRHLAVHSPEGKHRELLEAERALFEQLLLNLADRIENARAAGREAAPATVLQRATAAANAMGEILGVFSDLLADMQDDPLTPEDVLRDFVEVHSQLQGVLDDEKKLLKDVLVRPDEPAVDARDLAPWLGQNQDAISELERGVLVVDRLIDRQHQARVLDNGRELVDQSEHLRKLLDRLAAGDDALKLDVLREIDQMQQALQRMGREMRRQAKALPDERFNPWALGDRGAYGSVGTLQDEFARLRQLVEEGRIEEARQRLEELARSASSLLADLEEEYADRSSARMARTERQIRRIRKRVDRMVRSQERVHDATGEQESIFRRQIRRRLADRIEGVARREAGRIARLREQLRSVDAESLHDQDRETLQQAKDATQDVHKLLREGDIGQASKVADWLDRTLRRLRSEVGQGAMLAPDRQQQRRLRRSERVIGQARETAHELADDLQSLLPDPEELLSRRDERKLERLGRSQGVLAGRVGRMRKSLEPLGEEHPGLQRQFDEAMAEIQRSMERASEELGQLNPSLAEEHQRSALDKLRELRNGLDRAARPMDQAGGVGISDPRARVEIPQADDYDVPKEFRQELLEAMKEDAPPTYRKLIEQYYEALVQ